MMPQATEITQFIFGQPLRVLRPSYAESPVPCPTSGYAFKADLKALARVMVLAGRAGEVHGTIGSRMVTGSHRLPAVAVSVWFSKSK
jgi:hypothetical protein